MTLGTVLIVDDEPPMRELLRRWLQPMDYIVIEADSADAALEMMRQHPTGVVLCDIAMPGNGGDWLIQQMLTAFPAVAVVLATAEDSLPPRISLQPNVVGYLVKPFSRSLVLSAVHEALLWHRAASKRRR